MQKGNAAAGFTFDLCKGKPYAGFFQTVFDESAVVSADESRGAHILMQGVQHTGHIQTFAAGCSDYFLCPHGMINAQLIQLICDVDGRIHGDGENHMYSPLFHF